MIGSNQQDGAKRKPLPRSFGCGASLNWTEASSLIGRLSGVKGEKRKSSERDVDQLFSLSRHRDLLCDLEVQVHRPVLWSTVCLLARGAVWLMCSRRCSAIIVVGAELPTSYVKVLVGLSRLHLYEWCRAVQCDAISFGLGL